MVRRAQPLPQAAGIPEQVGTSPANTFPSPKDFNRTFRSCHRTSVSSSCSNCFCTTSQRALEIPHFTTAQQRGENSPVSEQGSRHQESQHRDRTAHISWKSVCPKVCWIQHELLPTPCLSVPRCNTTPQISSFLTCSFSPSHSMEEQQHPLRSRCKRLPAQKPLI